MEVPKRTNLSFHFSKQLIKNILKGFIVLNFLFLFGTWLHNSLLLADKWYLIPRLIALLDLAKENNLAAWYSSMFMIIVALAAFFCFLVDFIRLKKTKDQIMNFGWLVLGLIFLVLSFDEMGSFHEMIGNTPKLKNIGLSNNATRIVFFGLIAIIGVFMVGFSFLKFRANKRAFIFAAIGVLFLISNPFQEMYEMYSWRTSIDPSKWRRPIFFMILEEGTEIFASFCFLKAFILYALNPEGEKIHGLVNRGLRIKFFVNNFYIYVLSAFIICSGLVMIIFRMDSWEIEWNKGIPHNWFPSAMSLLVALIGSYLYFLSRDKSLPNKITLLLITSVSLLTSAFYGCNMYDSLVMPFFKIPIPLLGASVLIGGLAFIQLEGIKTKVSIVAGVLCLVFAIYNRWGFFTAMSGYWAASFLLLALVFYYQQITLRLNKIL